MGPMELICEPENNHHHRHNNDNKNHKKFSHNPTETNKKIRNLKEEKRRRDPEVSTSV